VYNGGILKIKRRLNMARYSHFVVRANHKTGKFEIDQDTCDAHFPDGCIYDTAKNEWVKLDEIEAPKMWNKDAELYTKLQKALTDIR
jgi:hypothetical protein